MSDTYLILGIDPGIERFGWGLVEKNGSKTVRIDSGVKRTLKTKTESARLWEISQFLDNLIKKTHPDVLGTEKLFFAQNVKTALVIGEVRGIILSIAEKHSLPIKEFTPLEVKVAVCGYGRANKKGVADMVKILLNMPKKGLLDDETDALALALATAAIHRFP